MESKDGIFSGTAAPFNRFRDRGRNSLMWFESWPDMLGVLLAGSASYAALVMVPQASPQRTPGKLKALDLNLAVAPGPMVPNSAVNSVSSCRCQVVVNPTQGHRK